MRSRPITPQASRPIIDEVTMEFATSCARLWVIARPDTQPRLRQGVWYPVVGEASGDRAVLGVGHRKVAIARRFIEIREQRPERFTVVYRGQGDHNPAEGTKGDLGTIYAVCPACGARVRLQGRPDAAACGKCAHQGEIAWWETG